MPIRSAAARTVSSAIPESPEIDSNHTVGRSGSWDGESVRLEDSERFRPLEEVHELMRQRLLARGGDNRGALVDRRVERGGDLEVAACLLQCRRERKGERDDPDGGASGLRELRGLRDVLAEHEFVADLIVELTA